MAMRDLRLLEDYTHHCANAVMYRLSAEAKLDRRYHPSCAIGELNYARDHEQKAQQTYDAMLPSERPDNPPPFIKTPAK